MLLLKTDKARQNACSGMRTLSLRERSLLLLAEGQAFGRIPGHVAAAAVPRSVEHLLSQGYRASAPVVQDLCPPHPPTLQPSALRPEAVTPPEPSDHLRSLAGARMYLFVSANRLFARRDPARAQHFHSALRAARDRDSMLHVGESLLEEVSQLAGAERAETDSRAHEAAFAPRAAPGHGPGGGLSLHQIRPGPSATAM